MTQAIKQKKPPKAETASTLPTVASEKPLTDSQKATLTAWMNEAENGFGPVKLEQSEERGFHVPGDCAHLIGSLLETTANPNEKAGLRLIGQLANLTKDDLRGMNENVEMLHSLAPQTPLEGLLAGQMVASHTMAMEMARRAIRPNQTPEGIDRYLKHSEKLMGLFTRQVEALHKLRHGGKQVVQVQHVNVHQGGQAVVGEVVHRGRG